MEICYGAAPLAIDNNTETGEDLAILEGCRRYDAEAFGQVVDRYQKRVFGFVKRMVRDEDDASDLTQEVFIKAFQNIKRFDGRSSMRTWLFKIAHNLCIDHSRRAGRLPKLETIDSTPMDDAMELDLPDTRWQPETLAVDQELMEVVEKGIAEMSEKLRPVLLLHDREDLSYEEIAQLLEIPMGTVKSRLFLARAFLHDRITAYLNEGVASYE